MTRVKDYPVRKTTLERQGTERDVRDLTPAQRMAVVGRCRGAG